MRLETTQSPRGNILDRSGKLLATNRPLYNVYWQGSGSTSLRESQREALSTLETILAKDLLDDPRIQQTIRTSERFYKKELLASDITFEQLSKIKEQLPDHKNIHVETNFQRYYPHKSFASHILGYLGRINLEASGKMGLEKHLEDTLKGEHGATIKKINSLGKKFATIELKKALAGNNIQTTIDIKLQHIIERIFPQDQSGTFIIMDPEDGAIVALTSQPNFDPSIFLQPIHTEDWQALQEKKPFLNRAFNASYPPGSIFKLVTISAALEHGITPIDSLWDCKGYTHYGKRKYWCNRRYGHGELTTRQAVAQSCNILFYEIGKKIDIDILADYAQRFGFGQKTNTLFPEKTGLIPTRQWKQEVKGEQWWPGETLSAAIGQSFLLTSPIQVARMISSIFTGYLVNTRILLHEPVIKEPLRIAPETRKFLKKSMRAVVTKGTGRRVNKVKNIEIYAKTSTAQTSSFNKRRMGGNYLEHGWFVAHFSYKDMKPLTLVILAENVGSSKIPTIMAKDFLIEYKKLVDNQSEIVV